MKPARVNLGKVQLRKKAREELLSLIKVMAKLSRFFGEKVIYQMSPPPTARDSKPNPGSLKPVPFKVGDWVLKSGGDYNFHGQVVSVFTKRSGALRYVVENGDGILHIFGPLNLVAVEPDQPDRNGENRPYQLPKFSKL